MYNRMKTNRQPHQLHDSRSTSTAPEPTPYTTTDQPAVHAADSTWTCRQPPAGCPGTPLQLLVVGVQVLECPLSLGACQARACPASACWPALLHPCPPAVAAAAGAPWLLSQPQYAVLQPHAPAKTPTHKPAGWSRKVRHMVCNTCCFPQQPLLTTHHTSSATTPIMHTN